MLKRLFDISASLSALILLSPLLTGVALVIKSTSTGPIFFRQTRCARDGKTFRIYKFRTMITDAEQRGLKITVGEDKRITKIGHVLRDTKVDELPQLLNVLLGEMSVVGPRPEVPEFMQYYNDDIRTKILSVRPGITDLASIEFSKESELLADAADPKQTYIDEIMPIKGKYYCDYVDNMSIKLDLHIIFRTIQKIWFR